MEEIFLEAEPREELGRGKVKDLREKGFIPAVVYAQGKESLSLKVSHKELLRLIHQHRIESVVINLKVKNDNKDKPRACLIKEIQYNPVHDDILHVDFNEISLSKVIKVNVPVVAKGEPVGVKQEGGSLEHILWEIEVECLPGDIPKGIEVDASQLKIGDSIHIKDITFPSGVKVLNDPAAIILSVTAPMKEEVPVEAVEGAEMQEPEVIKEKKEIPAEGEQEEEPKEKK
jgi:large subunit ribosomal protein L25